MMTSKPERVAKPSKKDKERYLLSRRGWTTEQLAARENVREPAIKDSIARYQLYRDSLAIDEQDLHIAEMTSRLMPGAEKVLAGAMTAKRTIYTGKKARQVIDHDTRIRGVETLKSFMEAVRPKGGGISINTQVNNGRGENGNGSGRISGFDFESRLRKIRAEEGLSNDDERITDADYEDADSGRGLSDQEKEDIGMDPDGENEGDD